MQRGTNGLLEMAPSSQISRLVLYVVAHFWREMTTIRLSVEGSQIVLRRGLTAGIPFTLEHSRPLRYNSPAGGMPGL